MLADIDHLFRDDVPFVKLRNKGLLQSRKLPSASHLVLANEVLMVNGVGSCRYCYATGLCKDEKLTGNHGRRGIGSGIQLCLRDTVDIARLIHVDLDVGRIRFVFDSAVCVIAKNCHTLRCLGHIRVTCSSGIHVSLEMFLELLIAQQGRHHGHHDRSTVIGGGMQTIAFHHFRITVKTAGGDIAGDTVKDNQVVRIRSFGGLVFRDHSVVDDADSTFTVACHTVDQGMNCLDNRAAQSSFCSGAVLR